MDYTLIIAEKPQVAKSIAAIVGATTNKMQKANGYKEGNGYIVTWAFGHLVGLDRPEDAGFPGNVLPIFPERFGTHIIRPKDNKEITERNEKQMKTLDALMSGAKRIIVATDAGREGELIFRYIYEYTGCRTPFDRLWISSLTDEAIRKGLRELLPGDDMDALSEAAHARSEADWLVGFNASRALRVASGYKGRLSLGRVQTPVLCMICDRYEANRNFVPTPFWQITALAHKDMTNITVLSEKKYTTQADAEADRGRAEASKRMRVTKVEKKQVTTKPPLLYDLTALQRAANTRYGLTADETLDIAQKLYMDKYLTYPRTGSRYITEDVFKTIPDLIRKAASVPAFAAAAAQLEGKKLCRKSVDASKVTDHHALLPTDNMPTNLTGNHLKIWEMVCARMLEAFGEDSISERTSVSFECGGVPFKATGSVPVKAGWKGVLGNKEAEEEKKDGEAEKDESENGKLPPLTEGEVLPAAKIETVRKTDKPLPIYTDASLLADMETCGKRIEDEEIREAMKDVGLGTPATRAETIKTLIANKYIDRSGKKLVPTELGTKVAATVKGRKIADVRVTGEWERDLALIEKGQQTKTEFDRAIRRYVEEINDDLMKNCTSFAGVTTSSEPQRTCPLCGRAMKNLKFNVTCTPEDGGCGFKIPREILGKKLPASAIAALAEGKKTEKISGFTSKKGTKYISALKIDRENRKVAFDWDDPAPEMKGKTCPCCGETLADDKWKLSCGCGFTLWKTQCGVPLDEGQVDRLLAGEGVFLKGMKNKAGKAFDATVTIDKEKKGTAFAFSGGKKKSK